MPEVKDRGWEPSGVPHRQRQVSNECLYPSTSYIKNTASDRKKTKNIRKLQDETTDKL